jgi:hypothetical protein
MSRYCKHGVIADMCNNPECCPLAAAKERAEARGSVVVVSRELPEIVEMDRAAQEALEARRRFLRPHKQGWWRNLPNPHAVGSQIDDDEL